jgi:pimeloyl-ACP methyl ester carboxylesterase
MKLKTLLAATLVSVTLAHAWAQSTQGTKPCRVAGFRSEVQCGVVQRPLNPNDASAGMIDVHYVVVTAVARNKKPDAVFFFAGGPGQSAIKTATQTMQWFRRLNNWRDIVFIDQRGTGKSAPLICKADDKSMQLSQALGVANAAQRVLDCMPALAATPQGKALDQFSTTIAMQDADAVRAALGAQKINLVGVSYGTRAAMEYARQFPQRTRRVVLDGVAPPDMVLPATFGIDAEKALDGWLAGCEGDAQCKAAYPNFRSDLQKLLDAPPTPARVVNPMNGREEAVTINREMIVALLRSPLYVPTLSASVPFVVTEAAAGRFTPLVGLSTALGGGLEDMAWGMHFSVVCSEDVPRLATTTESKSALFGDTFSGMYAKVCERWPRAKVPAEFYSVPTAQFPVLALSGGADPATPPRHGERVAKAMGANAKHIVVPQAGHGVLSIGCMRDEMLKFINAEADAEALKVDGACAASIPRPTAWVLPGGAK